MESDPQSELRAAGPGGASPNVSGFFDLLFRHASDGVFYSRTDGTVLRANPAACKALGRTEAQILAAGRGGLVVPDAPLAALLAERARTGVATGELTFLRTDGSSFTGEVTTTLLPDPTGGVHAYVIFRDVTEQRRLEAAARAREARLRAYFDSPIIGTAITSPDRRWLEVNDRICSMLGYSRDELTRRTWSELTHPEDLTADVREFDRVLAGEIESYTLDKRFLRKDGTVLWAMLSLSCARRPDGGVDFLVCHLKDVGQRKAAEEALRQSEARLARVLAGSSDGFFDIEVATRQVAVSQRYWELLGLHRPASRVSMEELYALLVPADLDRILPDVAPLRAGTRDHFEWEYRVRLPDGTVRWIQSRGKVTERDGRGLPSLISGTVTDIDQRRRAAEALRESEGRFRMLADQTPVAIFRLDAQARVTYVNPAFLATTQVTVDEAYHPAVDQMVYAGDRDQVLTGWRESLAAGRVFSTEYRQERRDGSLAWLRAFAAPLRAEDGTITGYVGVLVDITEQRDALVQLAKASRLSALGTLVAGVAHEVNNPLTGVVSGTAAALEVVGEARRLLAGTSPLDRPAVAGLLGEAWEALEDARAGGERVARIVKELRSFGQPELERAPVALGEVVTRALRLVPGAAVSVAVEDLGAPEVVASSGQVQQVVVALVTNALKATPPEPASPVTIRIGPGVPGMARLEVADRGRGIAPAVLERIFEPFFTTGEVGQGMGMGLAVSHAIVQAHRGTLTVESAPGRGSTFRVELPVVPVTGPAGSSS